MMQKQNSNYDENCAVKQNVVKLVMNINEIAKAHSIETNVTVHGYRLAT